MQPKILIRALIISTALLTACANSDTGAANKAETYRCVQEAGNNFDITLHATNENTITLKGLPFAEDFVLPLKKTDDAYQMTAETFRELTGDSESLSLIWQPKGNGQFSLLGSFTAAVVATDNSVTSAMQDSVEFAVCRK